MTDTPILTPPSSLELRDELERLVIGDLLGPAGGPDEIVTEPYVRGRYLVGMLAPRGEQLVSADEVDGYQSEIGPLAQGGTDGEDGASDAEPVLPDFTAMLPSSFGLTFSIARDAAYLQIIARWGQYKRVSDPDAEPSRFWQRQPIEAFSVPIPIREGNIDPWFPDPENKDVYVRGLIRQNGLVTVFLVNAQKEPPKNRDEAWLFQPELVVRGPGGEAVFERRAEAYAPHDPEDRAMAMLYHREIEFAVGHGVGVEWEKAPDDWSHAIEVRTAVVPRCEVERMEPPTHAQRPEFSRLTLDMETLAETVQGGFSEALGVLPEAYIAWIEEQSQHMVDNLDLHPYRKEARTALTNCTDAMERIREGLVLLDNNPEAAEAFRFANRAMWYQRVRTLYARAVRRGTAAPDLATLDIPQNRSWRPFQLAFILLNLPSLVDPTRVERSDPEHAYVDLLWFPTGGGKTEAYLGVAAFTLAIRRLQGVVGGYDGSAGIAVLMRYTLRLLTLQQFQRATSLICACEVIRQTNPELWGAEPFRIGLWVGRRSTPNRTSEAAESIKRDHGTISYQGAVGGSGTPAQLTNCPWCGSEIRPGRDIIVESYQQGRGRTLQFCGDPRGECPFSRRQSPDEGLPILVVDEEVYRRLPSLLIATVDKFAQMAWKGPTQMLFGRVIGYCPRHGFRSPEIEDSDHHNKKGRFPTCDTIPIGRLRPPDLIIQDELHLISGPLGTLVGLYETAVDELASWDLDGVKVRPKVIASTATIRRAAQQVNSLFMRDVKIFPPAALDADDSFFARRQTSNTSSPGRRYLGICAPGIRLKTVLIRVYTAYMAAAQVLHEKYGEAADPYMTLVGYFNSMRELGGMKRVTDDALRSRLLRMGDRGMKKRSIHPDSVAEITSRRSASEIPILLDRLEIPFPAGDPPPGARRPLDVVLATNMISVGVDVGRLGLMVVASQPKATAEYIQATSRVGRNAPGMVCAAYNWARPRDLSHYERFTHYHATFYRQVEALSVTPFSARALDRGLTGILVALFRLGSAQFNANQQAGQVSSITPEMLQIAEVIAIRAATIEGKPEAADLVRSMIQSRFDAWVSQANAVTGGAILGYQRQQDGRTRELLKQPYQEDWSLFTCLNSLRDVEPGVALVLKDFGMDRVPNTVEEVIP